MLAVALIGGEPPQHREALTSHYAADANRTNDTILFFVLFSALLCFLWFLTALSERLHDAGHMSRLALLAGAACAVLLMAAITVYASTSVALQMHQDLVLDVDTHRLIRTVGTLLFVAALLAAIPLIAASSTAALQTRRLPRWLAWLGFPAALTFLAAPFDPSLPMFTLFTWTAMVSVVMLLRPAAVAKPVPAAESTATRGANPASKSTGQHVASLPVQSRTRSSPERPLTVGSSDARAHRKEPVMRRISRNLIVAAAVLALAGIAPVPSASAQPGPADISGEINGAPFRIVVPAVWNGTLVEFVRGYVDKADHPGEVDNRNPTIAPSAADRDALLAGGYALAGSARKDNGWSVEEGLDDVVALASYFRENVANPTSSILWGGSLGTVITLETAERNGGVFDGYLATPAVGAGAPRFWDQALVLRLAYDVTFGMPGSWGTPGDVRDDLDYETEVAPILSGQVSDPANFGWFEFIRLVAGIPGSGITPPPGLFPGALSSGFRGATEFQAELERRAGGPIAQNITHTYALTSAEKAYLASLGVDADPLLAAMNARRDIAAPPESRNYLEHFADYSGLIKRPVLTLHNALDVGVVVAHESAYRDTVAAVDRDHLLVQVYTTGIGHGGPPTPSTVAVARLLAAIHAIDNWARSGTPPAPSTFPAELGFIPGFDPPAWPQP